MAVNLAAASVVTIEFAKVGPSSFSAWVILLSHHHLKPLLYVICVLADFAGFVVVFAVSRGLAEQRAEPWLLGLAGAGFAFSSGMANLVGGWLSHRFDGRWVFLFGAGTVAVASAACAIGDSTSLWFLPGYWAVGAGLGCVYPTLIGWLNRGEDAHANRRGVSRTLILFCVSWNAGMMGGQLTAGSLFDWGTHWPYGVAVCVAGVNLLLAIVAARLVNSRSSEPAESRTTQSSAPGQTAPIDSFALQRAANFKRLSWIANLGSTFGGSLLFHMLPDLAVSIGVPADSNGSVLAYWRGVIIVMYLCMHFIGFWHYRFVTSVVVQLAGALGLVIIAQAESAAALFVGVSLHGLLAGYNYFSGLFYATAGSSEERRTLAAGIHEATLAAGMAIGTVTGGILGTLVSNRTPYLLASAVLVSLVLVQVAVWWRLFVAERCDTVPTAVSAE